MGENGVRRALDLKQMGKNGVRRALDLKDGKMRL